MQFDISVAMTWILFIALFPISFVWLRRAWRIFINRDFSEVALKNGEPPKNCKKYAWQTGLLNLLAGLILVINIAGIIFVGLAYETWSAIAGSTIWIKIMLDYAISRWAHLLEERNK